MDGSTTKSIVGVLGVGVLLLGLSGPAMGQKAAPPASNPGLPLNEILAQIGILNGKLDDLKGKVDNLPGLGPCEVPPVWGQTYATADRFVSVLGGAAFCDKATGLVWEGSPDPAAQGSWQGAINYCTQRTVGGVCGFHLPLIEQLTSLLPLLATDLNSATGAGPFSNVQSADYWSATTTAVNPTGAWFVSFFFGSWGTGGKGVVIHHAWCVRGGQSFDGNTHTTLH